MTGILAMAASYPDDVVISITDRTVNKYTPGGISTAVYIIDNDGTVRNHNNAILETWLGPRGVASNYEVRATLTAGSTPSSGTLNTWLSCGSDQAWVNSSGPGVTKSSTLLIEIRSASSGIVKDSATIELIAGLES